VGRSNTSPTTCWSGFVGVCRILYERARTEPGLHKHDVSDVVDPTFAFVTADRARQIRLDCSSAYAMKQLVG
jgi:phosphoglucomutase